MRRIEAMLGELAARAGPFSSAAKTMRRLHGEPVSRVPGRCRCGEVGDAGFASCTPCRARSRSRSQRVRLERRDAINAWRRAHRRRLRLRRHAFG